MSTYTECNEQAINNSVSYNVFQVPVIRTDGGYPHKLFLQKFSVAITAYPIEWPGYGLDDRGKGRTVCLFSKAFRSRLWGPSKYLFNCLWGRFTWGQSSRLVKLVTFPLLSAEIMEKCFCAFTFPYVIMAYIATSLPLLWEVHEWYN
jgi:hypothetical protein